MADSPYTKKREFQFRGPQSSEDYNSMTEEQFKDLVFLYNKTANVDFDMNNGFIASVKDTLGISQYLDTLETRIASLEGTNGSIAFTSDSQIDNDRFNSIPSFVVNATDRCTYHNNYNMVTLPKVASSSMSKIKFVNTDGTYYLPTSLEMLVTPVTNTADNSSAVIDTSQPFNAVTAKAGKVWERNVITTSANLADGAQCYLFVRIPTDLSSVSDTNGISFTPFPLKNVDVLEIAYSTSANVALGTFGSDWTVLNSTSIYYNAPGAAGNIAPGAWSGDEILKSGQKSFYFDPLPMTAVRIKLRQKNYYNELSKYIYSYGLSKLDIRYDKFLDTGKTIIRFDAPDTKTITNVTAMQPQIWNVAESLVSSVFSYRVIWETSFNSGTYTLTPVPLSKRVWVEVTLRKTTSGGTPSLSGLIMKYS